MSTPAELRRYLDAVVDATRGGGVAAQVAAFRAGFDALFPLDCLGAFYEDEIEVMLCGERASAHSARVAACSMDGELAGGLRPAATRRAPAGTRPHTRT